MALTGKLVADFDNFYQAVQKSETQLRLLDSGATKVTSTLQRTGEAFSGRAIIQQATLAQKAVQDLGGVTSLTSAEQVKLNATLEQALAKYAALGQTAPPGMQALADATKKTDDAWGDLKNNFDPKAAIADPLGAASGAATGLAGALGPLAVATLGVAGAFAAAG